VRANSELAKIRDEIDAIDQEIQRLINARAECAQRVAVVKQSEMADSGDAPIYYRPERESQILSRVIARNQGPLPGVAWRLSDRSLWVFWDRWGPSQSRPHSSILGMPWIRVP
jgi:chorismate mutase-like protein